MLTGDRPDEHPGVAQRLADLGFEDFVGYVVWCCERALERGLLPHTNLGALRRDELLRLREVTASQGLMLESLRDDLVVHQASPTKDPALRLDTIRAAGELRIPFTSGILVGIGESEADRVAALEALAAVHAEYGHLQEVILQNYVPHRRYYGEEPAEIAEQAAERVLAHGDLGRAATRRAGVGDAGDDRGHEAADRARAPVASRRGRPGPAQPRRLVARAGRRGRDRPRRTVGQRRPHLPGAPVPLAAPGAQASRRRRRRLDRAAVRLRRSTSTPSGSPRACSTSSRRRSGRSSHAAGPVVPRRRSRSAPISWARRSRRHATAAG